MQSDIIFIRHAQSLLNIASHNFRVNRNMPYSWSVLCKYDQFLKGVKYNPEYLDCPITQTGVNQCIEARKLAISVQPDIILVSPMRRTLQTCHNIFGEYIENRKIPVIVQPVLAEALRSSCDISDRIQTKMKEFPHYDWTAAQQKGDHWYIMNDSKANQEKYFEVIKKSNVGSYDEEKHQVLKYMAETKTFEQPSNVRRRAQKVKALLREYKGKYSKIVVVSHYNTINYTCATTWTAEDEPVNSLEVKNCQVFGTSLERLLKYD